MQTQRPTLLKASHNTSVHSIGSDSQAPLELLSSVVTPHALTLSGVCMRLLSACSCWHKYRSSALRADGYRENAHILGRREQGQGSSQLSACNLIPEPLKARTVTLWHNIAQLPRGKVPAES
jgi:hypothetical protein